MPQQNSAVLQVRQGAELDASDLISTGLQFNARPQGASPEVIRQQVFALFRDPLGVDSSHEVSLIPNQRDAIVGIAPSSAHAAKLEALTEAIAETQTEIGFRALERSVLAPPRSPVLVQARQDSVRTLEEKPALRAELVEFLSRCAEHEQSILQFIQGEQLTRSTFAEVGAALLDLQQTAKDLVLRSPPYMAALLMEIEDLGQSRTFRHFQNDLVAGPDSKLLLREEASWWQRLRDSFYPWPFDFKDVERTALVMLAFEGCTRLAGSQMLGAAAPEILATVRPISAYMGFLLAAQICIIFNKEGRDLEAFFQPLREALAQDPSIQRSLEAVGLLDELLSLTALKSKMPLAACYPVVEFEGPCRLQAVGLHNPLLTLSANPHSVGNDLSMNGDQVLAISGARGSGRDTLLATLAQSQVLALLGAAVPARQFCCTAADRIVLQSGLRFDGALETQTKETRLHLEQLGPSSFWALNAGGRRLGPEQRESLGLVLESAHRLGVPTVAVIADPELLNRLGSCQPPIANALQLSSHGPTPTFRLEPGISWDEPAAQASDSSNLSRESLELLLKQRGALDGGLRRWNNN